MPDLNKRFPDVQEKGVPILFNIYSTDGASEEQSSNQHGARTAAQE